MSLTGIVRGEEQTLRIYIGTYTRNSDSEGIYTARLNLQSGELTDLKLAAKTENPSFLALSPDGKSLYAVSEISAHGGQPTGGVTSFSVAADGSLSPLNSQPSGGAGPCHLITDTQGKNVLVANYGGGSIAVIPIGAGGQLESPSTVIQHEGSSVNEQRQKAPHAHSINLDPDGRFAFVADLGTDKVNVYAFDPAAGSLKPADPPAASVEPGAGPRHFTFHPSGKFAWVINELDSTITGFTCADGKLTPAQTVTTLPPGFGGDNTTADIHVHPSGKFLYGSNRGHDSIAVYEIDQESGKLTYVQHQATLGKTLRNFAIDPSGTFLLAENQQSNDIYTFRIDPHTGKLSWTGHKLDVPRPVCIVFASNN